MRIKVTAATKYVGSKDSKTVEVDADDLDGLDERGRTEYLEEIAKETLWDLIDWDWEEA